jgi:dihydrofolate reductase
VTVTLFIATSLDGYIAGPDDDLSWLFTDADYGFTTFFSEVDTLVIGRGTYEVVRRFGEWPYPGKRSIVVSRKQDLEVDTPDTTIHSGDLEDLLEGLRGEGAQHVWLVGGGELVRSFLEKGLLDRVTVSLHPVLLGHGIPLFPSGFPKTLLMFEDAEAYESGLVQLNYIVVSDDEDL